MYSNMVKLLAHIQDVAAAFDEYGNVRHARPQRDRCSTALQKLEYKLHKGMEDDLRNTAAMKYQQLEEYIIQAADDDLQAQACEAFRKLNRYDREIIAYARRRR